MSISCEPTSQKSATTAVAERATDRARLVELEARILECERSLRLFKMERYQVQSRLAAYTYPVLTLPPEIVSEIFEYFLPTYPTRPAALSSVASPNPMLLCQICRAWRELALATPALWCAFTLRLNTARAVAEKPHYMELALARSGSHPLSLRLECNVVPRHNSPLPLSPFFHTLAPHRARLEHLSLCGSLESLSALHGPLPLLRTVSLASLYHVQTGGEPLTAAFRAAPLLRSAALSSYSDIYAGVLPWAQLTALTVDQIPLHGCHAVLARAPHLVHCRFTLRAWLPDVGLTCGIPLST
ncbi:hypothetical protein B0H15DRAFT_832467 [Mycena belliarum]|uniref:F-box domain-containing protein n=1 Tax=Mycena belliarum TaxID=1033014 RepID=A0AAD6UC56_9AGAR|nr:hypothetical protein B0H15DRAFT_832467 [Mycena belliae]